MSYEEQSDILNKCSFVIKILIDFQIEPLTYRYDKNAKKKLLSPQFLNKTKNRSFSDLSI